MQRLISIGVISTVLAFSGAALAQEGMPDMPDSVQQQKMEEFMKANQPGPEHGRLAKLAGNWEMTFSYWTEPGAEAITDTLRGSSEVRWPPQRIHYDSIRQHGYLLGSGTRELQRRDEHD
jgi:hypothetical protein